MLIGIVPTGRDGAAADLLRAAGCDRIVALGDLGRLVAPGDVVVVGRLADLGEGLAAVVAHLAEFAGRGIGFRSLAEQLDSTAADGAARLAIALARQGGAATVRRRGRPPRLDARGRARARALLAAELPADQVAALLGVSRATVYRHLRAGPGAGPGAEVA